ncbi:MAG: hypothetical protein FD152_3693 [Xanthobacteraceae bacterium]|nr:MAG: hypothetical protein FD152_3693 [Xanthobacteraceae bacterium]
MTGPQYREPRHPPEGVLSPSLVITVFVVGALAALVFAFLAA